MRYKPHNPNIAYFHSLNQPTSQLARGFPDAHLECLVGLGDRHDLVSCVGTPQLAERAEQALARLTVVVETLLVVLRASQNLKAPQEREGKRR